MKIRTAVLAICGFGILLAYRLRHSKISVRMSVSNRRILIKASTGPELRIDCDAIWDFGARICNTNGLGGPE